MLGLSLCYHCFDPTACTELLKPNRLNWILKRSGGNCSWEPLDFDVSVLCTMHLSQVYRRTESWTSFGERVVIVSGETGMLL